MVKIGKFAGDAWRVLLFEPIAQGEVAVATRDQEGAAAKKLGKPLGTRQSARALGVHREVLTKPGSREAFAEVLHHPDIFARRWTRRLVDVELRTGSGTFRCADAPRHSRGYAMRV